MAKRVVVGVMTRAQIAEKLDKAEDDLVMSTNLYQQTVGKANTLRKLLAEIDANITGVEVEEAPPKGNQPS